MVHRCAAGGGKKPTSVTIRGMTVAGEDQNYEKTFIFLSFQEWLIFVYKSLGHICHPRLWFITCVLFCFSEKSFLSISLCSFFFFLPIESSENQFFLSPSFGARFDCWVDQSSRQCLSPLRCSFEILLGLFWMDYPPPDPAPATFKTIFSSLSLSLPSPLSLLLMYIFNQVFLDSMVEERGGSGERRRTGIGRQPTWGGESKCRNGFGENGGSF